jgi:hypothetical protein
MAALKSDGTLALDAPVFLYLFAVIDCFSRRGFLRGGSPTP